MKAIVIHAAKDVRIEEREAGSPGQGEVAVAIKAGGICGSDLHYYNHGGFGAIVLREPMILGHEVCGTITALGDGVSGLALGDLVAVNPSRPCRSCTYCLEGLPNHCLHMRFYGSAMPMPHIQGAFRQHLICDAAQCVVAPPSTSPALLAMTEPFSVALHAISRLGAVAGKRALVTGCGPIGTLAIAALRFYGARTIVATDIAAGALALAARMGADEAVNVNGASGDLSAFKADKGYFDILVECSGSERALRTALECLRPRGTIIQLGLGGDIAIPINVLVAKELALCGSFRFHEEFSLAAELIARKRVDLAPLVTGTYAFQEAEQAFIAAGDRQHHMKVQLAF